VVPVVFLHVESHAYTVIVDLVPPLLKSVTTSTSPSLCTPTNPLPPPTFVVAEADRVLEEPEPVGPTRNR
jgi:hypothetical protein